LKRGTTSGERFKEPPDVKPPAVMVVGKVVELRKNIKDKALASLII